MKKFRKRIGYVVKFVLAKFAIGENDVREMCQWGKWF